MAKKTKCLYLRGKTYWMTYVDSEGKQHWESTRTRLKADAEYVLNKALSDVREGKEPGILEQVKRQNAKHTFGDLCEKYKATCQHQKSYQDKCYLVGQLSEEYGGMQLKSINLEGLETYQSRLLASGLKPATVNRRLACLKNMMHKAARWKLISNDQYMEIKELELYNEDNTRLRFLTVEESLLLIEVCAPHLRPIVITALNTGMRKGEILNLTWDKVDLKHNFILLEDGKVKTGKKREIPINDHLKAVLKKESAKKRPDDMHYVFFDPATDKPYTGIQGSFITACKKAGIKDFHFHDLRHTFASQAVMNGADLPSLQKILGHSTIAMTMRYSHLTKDHLSKTVNIVGNLFKRHSQPQPQATC